MDSIELVDFINNVETNLGKTDWITVAEFCNNKNNQIDNYTYYCSLIENHKVEAVLNKYEWDLHIGNGVLGFFNFDNKQDIVYRRFSQDGIEPFVYWRNFPGKDQSYFEIIEEFRLYFNLFEQIDRYRNKILFYINPEDGEEDEVAIITENSVKIKLKYIKEFLAARQMHLVVYFEAMRFSTKSLEELHINAVDNVRKGNDYIYSLVVRNLKRSNTTSQSWIIGKKIIDGKSSSKPNKSFDESQQTYENFIIGVDEDGKEIFASCLATYQQIPNYITPVFFKKGVLNKYYDNPTKYNVKDGYVRKKGFWGLRIMNNHIDHIVVWLGDLRLLPYKEQQHWKAFNISPGNRKISLVDFNRNINGEFQLPENPELFFKYKYFDFQNKWHSTFGWYLFKPLSNEDKYLIDSLHIPTSNEQKEFDEQVSMLTKILIDSINQKELEKYIVSSKKIKQGIDKLEFFLSSKDLSSPRMIKFLRNLQSLRSSGTAHRKGKKYKNIKKFFSIGDKELNVVFEDILVNSIFVLNTLQKKVLE